MQEYRVKRDHIKDLSLNMGKELQDIFGVAPRVSEGVYEISFGALKRLRVSAGKSGKTILVETESDSAASDEAILETNRRFRKYLERVTGYTAKERIRMSRKEVEEDSGD